MRYFISILVLLLASLALGGCATSPDTTEDITEEPGDKTAVIQLDGNPTTGYSWEYTMKPEGIIQEVDNQYKSDTENQDIVGQGGEFTFTFSGVKAGETTLTFEYRRSWEEEEPLETKTFTATVDEALNITIK